MTHVQAAPVPWADPETLAAVRPEVRSLLESSDGFRKLPVEDQRSIAQTMVKVASYMSNPDGLAKEELAGDGVLARAQAEDPVEATKRRLSGKAGLVGAEFNAGALKQGTDEFEDHVKKVDFPGFVSSLIKGVFQAIVDSSIQQMEAYGTLLANVAKTVDQFAQDNISENNARDWLSNKYPDKLGVEKDTFGGGLSEGGEPIVQPRLTVTAAEGEDALLQISSDLGLAQPVSDLSDEEDERRLLQAARLQIARSRQQLLASMVMLGINRIVVTDGLIHAKVIFDFKAKDDAKRKASASMHDRKASKSSTEVAYDSWLSPVSASYNASQSASTTVESGVDESSSSSAEIKTKLTGEVRVNFKSDYLPMEKMATPEMIAAISGNAQPVSPTASRAGAAAQPAAPAPA